MRKKIDKDALILRVMQGCGIACFVTAAVLSALFIIMQFPGVAAKYSRYLEIMKELEQDVAALDNRWLIIVVIFLLYLLRSLSCIYPYTVVYIISAMVFEPAQSFIINMLGMALTAAIRYYTGMEMGEGYINRVLKNYPAIDAAFRADGRGSPMALLVLRVVPLFPLNTVSQLFGTMEFPFIPYMLISTLSMIPRLISYSFIGNNVYDPLSTKFFIPLILLLVFSGCMLFFIRVILGIVPLKKVKAEKSE